MCTAVNHQLDQDGLVDTAQRDTTQDAEDGYDAHCGLHQTGTR